MPDAHGGIRDALVAFLALMFILASTAAIAWIIQPATP